MHRMLTPITKLPYKVVEKGFFENADKDKIFIVSIESEDPTSQFQILCDVDSDPNPSAFEVQTQRQDAAYIVEACNKYPFLIGMLTTIEANTSDNFAAEKIRTFMNENKLW